MAKIPLRTYIHEIESLIEKNQVDEAIAHCRHILKYFPKSLAAYRLLGKAYLELQRYGDAADIFLRVLSAAPDDYVSHVGMSIIREDEGNLDAAIWHMERAFEVQPYNSAIQGELRRLYGRRDGIEPPKVRLTRGALARMYARGDLYQQAIGELRAALAQDRKRSDLQALLARMYFMLGQRVEAVEICTSLLKKLPYCLEANRIISAILPETERKAEAPAYHQKVKALDPYLAAASPRLLSGDSVPENIAILERMDYQPGQGPAQITSQPAWASSLGVSLDPFESAGEGLPEWLSSEDDGKKPEASSASDDETPDWLASLDEKAAQPPADEQELIPDWMQEAGWTPASGEEETPQPSGDFEDAIPDVSPQEGEDAIAPGDVPDWLRAMAPPGSMEDGMAGDEDEEVPPWLQDEKRPGRLQPASPLSQEELPDWLSEMESEEAMTEEVPEWLSEAGLADGESASEETPDWLQELEVESKEPKEGATLPAEETPEWLAEIGQEVEPAADKLSEVGAEAEGDSARAHAEMPAEAETPESEALPADEVPDWLANIDAEGEGEGLAAPAEAAALPADEVPDWLAEFSAEEESEAEADVTFEAEIPATTEAQADAVALPADEVPDWLAEIVDEGEGLETPAEAAALPADEALDWLSEVGVEEEPEAEGESEEAEVPSEATAAPQTDEPQTEEKRGLAGVSLEDEEAAMAWMESLAAKHGVAEEELVSRPEDRHGAPPEWLTETPPAETDLPAQIEEPLKAETAAEELPEPAQDLSEQESALPAEEALTDETTPEWLVEIEAEAAKEEAAPDWLAEIEAGTEETPAKVEASLEDEVPAWPAEVEAEVKDEGAEAPAEATEEALEEVEELPVSETGDWMAEAVDIEAAPAVEEPRPKEPEELSGLTGVSLEDEDAAMAWLESLAAKHGVAEEELVSKPEDRREAPPEWVTEAPSEVEEVADEVETPFENGAADEELPTLTRAELEEEIAPLAQADAEEVVEEALPDWLAEAEIEEEPVQAPEQTVEAPFDLSDTQPVRLPTVEEQAEAPEAVEEAPLTPEPPAAGVFDGMSLEDEDATMAWLESLAAKQGAAEEELLTSSEGRREAPPTWVQEETLAAEMEAEREREAASAAGPEAPAPEAEVEAEAVEPAEALEVEAAEAAPELPTWLAGAEEQAAEEEYAWIPPALAEEPEAGGLPVQEQAVEEAAIPSPVDVNTASLVDLENLPGIGFRLAQTILEYRKAHGPFKSIEELADIPEIGQELLPDIAPLLAVSAPETFEPAPEALEQAPHSFAPEPPVTDPARGLLVRARTDLIEGKVANGLEQYNNLIRKEALLQEVIRDLQDALHRRPAEFSIWQTLGDAYMRADQFQEALEAYSRAEELLP